MLQYARGPAAAVSPDGMGFAEPPGGAVFGDDDVLNVSGEARGFEPGVDRDLRQRSIEEANDTVVPTAHTVQPRNSGRAE